VELEVVVVAAAAGWLLKGQSLVVAMLVLMFLFGLFMAILIKRLSRR